MRTLEELLHLPTALVHSCHHDGRQGRFVGQKYQRLDHGRVFETLIVRIAAFVLAGTKFEAPISKPANSLVRRWLVHTSRPDLRFGASHKECLRLVHGVRASGVDVVLIHHVKGARLDGQNDQHVHIVQFAVADVKAAGSGVAQVQQDMALDGCLGRRKRCPIEQDQARIDSAAVQHVAVACNVHIQPQVHLGLEVSGRAHQHRSQVAPDGPIAQRVGVGERRVTHRLTKSNPLKLGRGRFRSFFDIAQRFSPRALGLVHDARLFGAWQGHGAGVARIALHNAQEARPRHIYELRT